LCGKETGVIGIEIHCERRSVLKLFCFGERVPRDHPTPGISSFHAGSDRAFPRAKTWRALHAGENLPTPKTRLNLLDVVIIINGAMLTIVSSLTGIAFSSMAQ
jgi:hypothetical protein